MPVHTSKAFWGLKHIHMQPRLNFLWKAFNSFKTCEGTTVAYIWFEMIWGQMNSDQIRLLRRVSPQAKSGTLSRLITNVCHTIKKLNKTLMPHVYPMKSHYFVANCCCATPAWRLISINLNSTINYQLLLLIDAWNGAITFRPNFMTDHIVVGLWDALAVWLTKYLI